MNWIENIMLRSVSEDQMNLLVEFLKQVKENYNQDMPKKVSLYRHAYVERDVSIHLLWESDKTNGPDKPSVLGALLIDAIKYFGMTSYSMWIETKMP